MADQNLETNENNNLPIQPVGETTLPVEPSISNFPDMPSASPDITPQAAEANIPPPPTMVVTPGNNGGVPKWFYFIFGITVIVFFLVTALLLLQLNQKQKTGSGTAAGTIPQVTKSNMHISDLTPTITATDSAVGKLNDVGNSDDIVSIEADLKNTDLMVLDASLNEVDNQMNKAY